MNVVHRYSGRPSLARRANCIWRTGGVSRRVTPPSGVGSASGGRQAAGVFSSQQPEAPARANPVCPRWRVGLLEQSLTRLSPRHPAPDGAGSPGTQRYDRSAARWTSS